MEVHAHSHSSRKEFKHYFFEFFMLFLAVFCGFLAENFREHYVDRQREKEYLLSMLDELKYDTAQYHSGSMEIASFSPILDSAYINVKKIDRYNYQLLGKWNTPINSPSFTYIPMMPIIEQLKSSGNLRLIENRFIINMILKYETYVRNIYQYTYDQVLKAKAKIFDLEDELCNYDEFSVHMNKERAAFNKNSTTEDVGIYNMPVIIKDPAKLNLLANSFVNLKGWNGAYISSMDSAKKIATELIVLINSKYP